MQIDSLSQQLLKAIIGLLISFGGIFGSIQLKYAKIISEPSLVLLITTSALIGLFIFYADKIKSISFGKGEIILKEIKDTESSIKILGQAIIELANASQFIAMESFDLKKYEKAVAELENLIS
jgi:hypothetical protein